MSWSLVTDVLDRARLLAWLIILASGLQLAFWSADRTPPFSLVKYEVAAVYPGSVAYVTAEVRRDESRGCSTLFSRYLLDSEGYRFDLSGLQSLPAGVSHELATGANDQLRLAVPIPPQVHPGLANFMTVLEYKCNPVHTYWPIPVMMNIPIEVLK